MHVTAVKKYRRGLNFQGSKFFLQIVILEILCEFMHVHIPCHMSKIFVEIFLP